MTQSAQNLKMYSKRNIHLFLSLRLMRPALLACFMLALAAAANATTAIIPSDDQMVISSRAIIRAKVISQTCGFDSRHNIVYTYVTVRIREVLKGQISSSEIVLKEPGGQVDSLGSVVFGSPTFTSGEEVILYLDTWADGAIRVHDMFLGKFSVTVDPHTRQRIAVRQVPGPDVETIPLTPVGSGSTQSLESTSRMELSAYLRLVRKKLVINAEKSQAFEDQYYRGQSMLERPPGYQDLLQSGGLTPQFHVFPAPFTSRWFEPDSGQPVNFLIDSDQAPSSGVTDDINAAMTAWSTVQGCSLRLVNGGSTTNCVVGGADVADFDNCKGFFSADGSCQTILAQGGYDYNPGNTVVKNGTAFFQIVEGYLSINPFAACYFGDHCNLREILTHEMGHTLGLHHSWDPTWALQDPAPGTAVEQAATMYYIAHFDGRCASIRSDDISGITFIYPGSGGGGLPPSISTTTLPAGSVGVAYSATLQASGGTTPYTWSIATASGPLPTGLTLATNGVISGSPSTSGNFGFMVVVTDAAQNTSQANLSILIAQPGGGGGGVGGFNSQFVSQSVPTSVQPGQAFQVTITWNNVGTASWTGGNVNLGSQNPPNNTTWGTARLGFSPGFTVPSLVQVMMSTSITAPSTPGVYQFQWQLTQDGGVGFFGDKSPTVAITVGTSSTLSASAPPLPTAITGTPYTQAFSATGGLPPYAWSVTTGSLPSGLKLDPAAGRISGTPSVEGNFDFTVTVSDSQSLKATFPLSLHILVVGPDAVPHIDSAKYKAGPQKLIIFGQNFDAAAVAEIDGATVTIRSKTPTQLVIKPVALASGNHTITVMNPNGVPPSILVITVN